MNVEELQGKYIRLLYGDNTPCRDESDESVFIISNMDISRLEVERNARVRNLRTVLHGSMRFLGAYISKDSLLPIVRSYCADSQFWRHRGRTLLEDFCLFFSQQPEVDPQLRLVCEIEGTLSGMSVPASINSPWPDHHQTQDGHQEALFAPWYASPAALLERQPLLHALLPSKRTMWKFTKKPGSLTLKVEKCV